MMVLQKNSPIFFNVMAAKEIKINNDINIKKEKTYGGDKCRPVYRRHACFIDYFYGYSSFIDARNKSGVAKSRD